MLGAAFLQGRLGLSSFLLVALLSISATQRVAAAEPVDLISVDELRTPLDGEWSLAGLLSERENDSDDGFYGLPESKRGSGHGIRYISISGEGSPAHRPSRAMDTLSGMGIGKRPDRIDPFRGFGFGKRARMDPFAGSGFGKRIRMDPFSGAGFGKRARMDPFAGAGFGKRVRMDPFGGAGFGKRARMDPFAGSGFGKRPMMDPFGGAGFGKRQAWIPSRVQDSASEPVWIRSRAQDSASEPVWIRSQEPALASVTSSSTVLTLICTSEG